MERWVRRFSINRNFKITRGPSERVEEKKGSLTRLWRIIIIQSLIIIGLLVVLFGVMDREETFSQKTLYENLQLISPRVASGSLPAQSYLIVNLVPLKLAIKKHIEDNNVTASVYVVKLRDGASFGINTTQGYSPASLNKVPLAMAIMQKVERGELTLDTLLEIQETDRDKGWGKFYQTSGDQQPVRVLLQKMLQESDNTAQRVLLRQMNQQELDFLLTYVDYYSLDIATMEGDSKTLPDKELINTRSMYNLFSSLYLSTVLEPQDSEYILRLMTNTSLDINSLADLPKEVVVSQKFGLIDEPGNKNFHSCGIIYISESRIFYCVMTKGLDRQQALASIGMIVQDIYIYIWEMRMQLDAYKEVIIVS